MIVKEAESTGGTGKIRDSIYYDWSTKGKKSRGRHGVYRLDILVDGKRLRKRSKSRIVLEEIWKEIKEGKFLG